MPIPMVAGRCLVAITLAGVVVLPGCGGTKVLKDAQPIQTTQALAVVSDQNLTASLDWVIVRDGPGTWAKNADWDEYLLRVSNRTDQSLSLINLLIVDSLDTVVEPQAGRKKLVKGSKQTGKRYKKTGLRVKAGSGVSTMLVAGAAVTAAGLGAATAIAYGSVMSGGATTAGGAGALAGGLVLLGPALAVGGIVRGVNNSAVNAQIEQRQTAFPLEVAAQNDIALDVFFPFAPSPTRVELIYSDSGGSHSLFIDTGTALHGLHIDQPAK